MVPLRERYTDLRKELLLYCCNEAWTKNGGRIPWNDTAICETLKTGYRTGTQSYERRFGAPFRGPVIPFVSMIEYHPILWSRPTETACAEDWSRLHQKWQESFTWYIPWICIECVQNLERRQHGRGHEGAGNIWTRQKSTLQDSMQRKSSCRKIVKNFIFPIADGTVKLSGTDPVFQRSTSIRGHPARESTTMFLEEHRTGLNHWTN